jgi:predicted RNase H-like nuclease
VVAVLGIDAAWTKHNDSGFALVEKLDGAWLLKAAGSNIQDFARACGVDAAKGAGADLALICAESAMGGRLPDIVAVDMPLSRKEIERRRKSDEAISRRFGAAKCATHSPSKHRPGDVGVKLRVACEARGYVLVTSPPVSAARSLAEVYPHPALLRLMGAKERVQYKVGKTKTYWPGATREERLALVRNELKRIVERLDDVIAGVRSAVDLESPESFSALKPVEDKIDAIVSAWVGIMIIEGAAEPFGDDDSAIWVPKEISATVH